MGVSHSRSLRSASCFLRAVASIHSNGKALQEGACVRAIYASGLPSRPPRWRRTLTPGVARCLLQPTGFRSAPPIVTLLIVAPYSALCLFNKQEANGTHRSQPARVAWSKRTHAIVTIPRHIEAHAHPTAIKRNKTPDPCTWQLPEPSPLRIHSPSVHTEALSVGCQPDQTLGPASVPQRPHCEAAWGDDNFCSADANSHHQTGCS